MNNFSTAAHRLSPEKLRRWWMRNQATCPIKRGVHQVDEQPAGVGIFLDRGHSAIETSDSHRSMLKSEIGDADLLREGQIGAKKLRPPPLSAPEIVPL
jgi:hypothetical protein